MPIGGPASFRAIKPIYQAVLLFSSQAPKEEPSLDLGSRPQRKGNVIESSDSEGPGSEECSKDESSAEDSLQNRSEEEDIQVRTGLVCTFRFSHDVS